MKEWYMMDTPPTLTSTYTNDFLSQYAQSNFSDVLETSYAKEVTLYDSSLQNGILQKCIINGALADTKLKSLERTALFPIGTIKAGMYVYYKGKYWIATGLPDNNGSYEKAFLELCQYKMKWQDESGKIIERWANVKTASKYNVGEFVTREFILSTDNLAVTIPLDKDGLTLDGQRVFIDNKDKPHKVYRITRSDDVPYDYQDEGVITYIADKTELNLKTDNIDMRICDYKPIVAEVVPPEIPNIDKISSIEGDNELTIGFANIYTGNIAVNGQFVQWDSSYTWEVESKVDIDTKIDNNKIILMTSNDKYVDEEIDLHIKYNNEIVATKHIIVSALI